MICDKPTDNFSLNRKKKLKAFLLSCYSSYYWRSQRLWATERNKEYPTHKARGQITLIYADLILHTGTQTNGLY